MGERRFLIIDINSRPGNNWLIEYNRNDIVIESEFKHRLDAAWGAASKFAPSSTWDWDKAIDILLNGTGKEQELTVCPYCFFGKLNTNGTKPSTLSREAVGELPDCWNCGGKGVISLYQPEPPKPTRKEWEEWAERFANFMYADPMAKAGCRYVILAMPGVPKE